MRVGRWLLRVLAVLGIAIGLVAALLYVPAHWTIRRTRPPLPSPATVAAVGEAVPPAALPERVYLLETARQVVPRAMVLDPASDPDPEAPYALSHPAFALAWPDGRLLLIDTGMEPEAARAFGRPLERLPGARPSEPSASVAEQLGAATARVSALLFTHQHIDHTQGVTALCAARPAGAGALRLYRTRLQAETSNFTTWAGSQPLEQAGCLASRMLPEGELVPVPDHPGVFVMPAAGHTPGSQVVLAFVRAAERTRLHVFTGDVANAVDGIRFDVPKPALYRWLLVPESEARLRRVRALLRDLEGTGARLVVSHDGPHLDALDLPVWEFSGAGPEGSTGDRGGFARTPGVRYPPSR